MVPKLLNLFCAIRESSSSQHTLRTLVQLCRRSLDNKGKVGVDLVDFSKALDCLYRELLIVRLETYGFGNAGLRFILAT